MAGWCVHELVRSGLVRAGACADWCGVLACGLVVFCMEVILMEWKELVLVLHGGDQRGIRDGRARGGAGSVRFLGAVVCVGVGWVHVAAGGLSSWLAGVRWPGGRRLVDGALGGRVGLARWLDVVLGCRAASLGGWMQC